ncbi:MULTISPECIES: hypothetical protein [unclassified Blastococcus]
MRRALAGLGAVVVLGTGCASIPAADEAACDRLEEYRPPAEEDPTAAELQGLLDDVGDVPGDEAITPALRDAVQTALDDAERLLDGRKAKYYDVHVGEALSVCMDLGW